MDVPAQPIEIIRCQGRLRTIVDTHQRKQHGPGALHLQFELPAGQHGEFVDKEGVCGDLSVVDETFIRQLDIAGIRCHTTGYRKVDSGARTGLGRSAQG